MSATEYRGEKSSASLFQNGRKNKSLSSCFCSYLLLLWLMHIPSRAAKSLGRRATGGQSERRESSQVLQVPLPSTPSSHSLGDLVCPGTPERDKGARAAVGAQDSVFFLGWEHSGREWWAIRSWNIWERQAEELWNNMCHLRHCLDWCQHSANLYCVPLCPGTVLGLQNQQMQNQSGHSSHGDDFKRGPIQRYYYFLSKSIHSYSGQIFWNMLASSLSLTLLIQAISNISLMYISNLTTSYHLQAFITQIQAAIISCLDYCNSLLAGLSSVSSPHSCQSEPSKTQVCFCYSSAQSHPAAPYFILN